MSKGQKLLELLSATHEGLRLPLLSMVSDSTLRELVDLFDASISSDDEFLGLAMVEITRRFMAKRSKRKKP